VAAVAQFNAAVARATIAGNTIPPPLVKNASPTAAIANGVPRATRTLRPRVFTGEASHKLSSGLR